jgi:hypothetical protein
VALAYNRFSDAVKAEALKEYLDSLEAYRAEVNVQSESDMRGVVGIPDVSTVLGNMPSGSAPMASMRPCCASLPLGQKRAHP